jgi:uncharacterized membrane protein YbhN (UPF0104 family)
MFVLNSGRRLFWLIKLIGIAIFVWLAFSVDHRELGALIAQTDIGLLALALLVSIAALNPLKVLRWFLILRWLGIRYSFWDAYCIYQASVFIGLITPGRLGEMFRSVYLKAERDVPLHQGLATVGSDRVFDLFGMLILAGGALVGTAAYGDTGAAGWWFLGGAVLAAVLFFALRAINPDRVGGWRFLGSTFMADLVAAFIVQLRLMTPSRLLLQCLITIAATTIYAYQCSLLAAAIGLSLDPLTAGGIAATVNLAVLIPVTVYGLGTRELTVMTLLGYLGFSQTQGFSFAMMIFISFWIFGALWGLLFWLIRPMEKRVRCS